MPELPEVETVVRTLRPRLVGRRIEAVWWSGKALRLARPLDLGRLRQICEGARIRAVRRRAKYVLLDVEHAGVPGVILIHLGMTGRLGLAPEPEARPTHCHVVWSLGAERGRREEAESLQGALAASGRVELRFVDARRFGWVAAAGNDAGLVELAQLGPDPLEELDLPGLVAGLSASSTPLKAFLLDQRRVVGIGNIYACEALFRARLHPALPAQRAVRRAAVLRSAIREVLELGIRNRGTSLRDYVDGDGRAGENQAALQVYGREGAPCVACGALIRRIVQSGRSTFFCARCQRR